jgi:hypothetical protein
MGACTRVRAQGPAVIADKLSYFIRTGQMVQLMQSKGLKITYIQLARFWPLPGLAAPPPPPVDAAPLETASAGA